MPFEHCLFVDVPAHFGMPNDRDVFLADRGLTEQSGWKQMNCSYDIHLCQGSEVQNGAI